MLKAEVKNKTSGGVLRGGGSSFLQRGRISERKRLRERHNLCQKVCFLTVCLFSSLDTKKPNCFHTSDLKPAGTSRISQTLSLATCSIHHFSSTSESSAGEQSRKASWGHTRPDVVTALPSALIQKEKRHSFAWKTYRVSMTTLRHFCHRRIVKLTMALHSHCFFFLKDGEGTVTHDSRERAAKIPQLSLLLFEEAHAGPRVTLASLT